MGKEAFANHLVTAAFELGGQVGWRRVSVAAAARHGGLDLDKAREQFPCTGAILARFGRLADMHALHGALAEGAVRDRLFDVVMRRIDYLQTHRDGVIALMRHAPSDPMLAVWLARANVASMGWMLEAAGISARGLRGAVRKRGLLAVWAWTLRAWMNDTSEDLSATMAALDQALVRAEQAARQFSGAMRDEGETLGAEPVPMPGEMPGEMMGDMPGDVPFAGEDDTPEPPAM